MVQPSQNRCREHPSVFGEAMTYGRDLVAFGQRIGNPAWCAKTRPMRLRGLAVVKLEQAAESLTTLHLACSDHRHLGCDQRVAQALVRPFFMIMVDKFPDGRSEMPFAERHQSGQTLGLGGFDKAFRKRVQIRTPRREDQGLHATVAQQAPKGRRVERIMIEDAAHHLSSARRYLLLCGRRRRQWLVRVVGVADV